MSQLIQATFDYSVLPDETALELRMSAERVRMRLKRSAEDIIAIGQELTAAKAKLAHGQFGVWLSAEFDMSQDTAERFVHVARRFGGDIPQIADFTPSILYQLAAPSTPEPVVQRVLSGEIPATTEAIKAAKEAERAARERANELQSQLAAREQERQAAERRIAQLTHAIDEMDAQVRTLRNSPPPEPTVKEVVKEVVPEAVQRRLAAAEGQLADTESQLAKMRKERDALAKRAYELQKQAELETQRHFSGEDARRIRMKWFSTRNTFATAARKLLADLPLAADTEQFDADDWQGLAELQAMVERVGEELGRLRQPETYIIEG